MKHAVLIPVYNAEKYLRECLDSVLAEADALKADGAGHDLAVFCCDDGSKDGSLSILQEYAARHANVRFCTQPNAGVSRTRNRLMDELPAAIEAFAFLDSDDLVRPGMYRALVEALVRTGADVAETEWDGPETVLDDMSVFLLRSSAPNKRWINVINKLYRRSSVGAIRFREELKFEEDLYFNFEVHQAIRRKVMVPGRFYYYRPNPASATSVLNPYDYFESCSRRLRLSCKEYLAAGRIPARQEMAFREELVRDAYRMCIRKNLKKTADPGSRREIFFRAAAYFRNLEQTEGFRPKGLNLVQRAIYRFCISGCYRSALVLTRVMG